MLTQSLTYHGQIDEKESILKEAALKNAKYFNIAKYLLVGGELGDMQEDIKQVIMQELRLRGRQYCTARNFSALHVVMKGCGYVVKAQ